MIADSARFLEAARAAEPPREAAGASFLAIYDEYVDFVWRTARRLGVVEGAAEDVVQEAFLVVHRRIDEVRRGSMRSWIYGITVRIVRNHRRTIARRSPHVAAGAWTDPDELADRGAEGPYDLAQRAEAARVLHALLATLDDDRREVFVLVELEQLSVPEAAEALGVNPNTVASRLRLAREQIDEGVRRYRARDEWRLK